MPERRRSAPTRWPAALGNDTYVVDNAGDVGRSRRPAAASTRCRARSATRSAADVENLTLTGTAAINGTGNALANMHHRQCRQQRARRRRRRRHADRRRRQRHLCGRQRRRHRSPTARRHRHRHVDDQPLAGVGCADDREPDADRHRQRSTAPATPRQHHHRQWPATTC